MTRDTSIGPQARPAWPVGSKCAKSKRKGKTGSRHGGGPFD